jgi:hypothetical protein
VDSKASGMVEEEEETRVPGMDLPIGERRALTALLGVQAAQEEWMREVLEVERKVRFCLSVEMHERWGIFPYLFVILLHSERLSFTFLLLKMSIVISCLRAC